MCLVIVVILFKMIKSHQCNTLIKCSTFLQVNSILITQQYSILKSSLQAKPNRYASLCLPKQTHVQYVLSPLKPQQFILIP